MAVKINHRLTEGAIKFSPEYEEYLNNYRNSNINNASPVVTTDPNTYYKSNEERFNESVRLRNEMLKNLGIDPNNIANMGVSNGAVTPVFNNAGGSYSTIMSGSGSYTQPTAQYRNYNWDDGSSNLAPDNPLIQPVVYNNEFSPASTANMANDIYNKYYAGIVEQQQNKNTQAYRDTAQQSAATAGVAGMATGSRGAVQLQNQANREAQEANLAYQQQMQLQAFQDTINARQLELQNKIADYENAWAEVQQYGYVVTEKTGQLLGIQPGQQLTTLDFKNTMSNIAVNVANINAQKVQLDQQQQQLDQDWIKFQEQIRQYEKDFAEGKRQFDLNYDLQKQNTKANVYSQLVDMLQRYDTVTPAMAALGEQVGMTMPIGSSTSDYLTEAERYANNQYLYGESAMAGGQTGLQNSLLEQQQASLIQQQIQASGGNVANAALYSALLSQWKNQGVSMSQIQQMIGNSKDEKVTINGQEYTLSDIIGTKQAQGNSALAIANQIVGRNATGYGGLNDYDIGKAEKDIRGDWGTAQDMMDLTLRNIPTNQQARIKVTSLNGDTRTFTLPRTVSGLLTVVNNMNGWNSGFGSIAGTRNVYSYMADYFYDANGNLKPEVKLQQQQNINGPLDWLF